ncbi:glucose-6-phosphate isomerase [Lysinibacillus sp. CTST325]
MSKQFLHTNILNYDSNTINWSYYAKNVEKIHRYLELAEDVPTGWLHAPLEAYDALFVHIEKTAHEIRSFADVLIVIGVGGSFLGARAVQDALTPYFGAHHDGIEVIYVGQNMSGAYMKQLLENIENKSVYVNVVSKSGGTMEPALAFRVLRQYMELHYGEKAAERIIVTTDAKRGLLKKIADASGYRQFVIPSNIGGRFSVLTAAGLLPMAVAGVDIYNLMSGAKVAALEFKESRLEYNEAYRYAVLRHALYEQGYKIELLASFEPALNKFHEWWKQLFGESEGKDRKGLYPSTVNFPTDLHAIGQFIQEGSPILFETLLHFHEIGDDLAVPYDARNEDGLNYLTNRTFNEINAISKEGTARAHSEGNVPVIQLELPKLDAYHIGFLIYFFMKACTMSAYLLGVNPFDQPGVETYKLKMMELLQEQKAPKYSEY